MDTLSVVTIAKNEEKNIESFLQNIGWVDEIILIDNNSSDKTRLIAKHYTQKIFIHRSNNLGLLKNFALQKATGDWILLLDVDERISPTLQSEIKDIITKRTTIDAFFIPYQNHFLGYPLKTLEQYAKARLFKREKGCVTTVPVHEEVVVKGKIGRLKGKLLHYSYRSIQQIIQKFTRYAKVEAVLFSKQKKTVGIQQITLYPLHMFWSIFIEDKGYRDGIWGFLLAVCFAYYELMRYVFLFYWQNTSKRVTISK